MYPLITNTLPTDALESYNRDTATVMTAMTFDTHGEPIDYLKQVVASIEIASNLVDRGVDTDVQLYVADDAVSLSQSAEATDEQAAREQAAADRTNVLRAIADLYAPEYDVEVAFTSALHDDLYWKIVDQLGEAVQSDSTLRKLMLQSVPDHRLDPDASVREKTEYTRRELAVILCSHADIKVGPARERYYDAAARDSLVRQAAPWNPTPVIGAYVTDTYPTNVSGETLAHLRRTGGILPYKASAPNVDPAANRIRLCDNEATIRRKLQQAPPELQHDLAVLADLLTARCGKDRDDESLTERLAWHLSLIHDVADLEQTDDQTSIKRDAPQEATHTMSTKT